MTGNVVTNVSDLTDAMRDMLLRPATADESATYGPTETGTLDALQRKGLAVGRARKNLALGEYEYTLTNTGKRCREALERQAAHSAVVVTNISGLTDAMRELLLRPVEPDLPAEGGGQRTLDALLHRGLITLVGNDPPTYRLTGAGKRCRDVLERQVAPTIVMLEVAGYGWALLNENDFGGHSITTWTRDEHTLVLVWQSAHEVTAAIYDGVPWPLDQIVDLITSDVPDDDVLISITLASASRRVQRVAHPRFAYQLAELLGVIRRRGDADIPRPVLRAAVIELARAIMATPER
jgi:hypothetical protein